MSALTNYRVGSSHVCWIYDNDNRGSFRATAIDPMKPTQGPLAGAIVGLVCIGIAVFIFILVLVESHCGLCRAGYRELE